MNKYRLFRKKIKIQLSKIKYYYQKNYCEGNPLQIAIAFSTQTKVQNQLSHTHTNHYSPQSEKKKEKRKLFRL